MSVPWEPGRGAWSHPAPAGGPYDGGPVDPYAGQPAPPPVLTGPPGAWQPAQFYGAPPARPRVPGALVGGSVVGYLIALFLVVSGFFIAFFGTVLGGLDELDTTLGDGTGALLVAGFGNWIAAGLLVTGGALATLRKASGLVVSLAAFGLVLLLAVFWVVLYPDGGIVFWALAHVLFTGLAVALMVLPPANRAWLAGA